ncbi:MAG: hypothetical protein ACM3U2_04670, partial [Deltaproteobacteria bacterium]
YLWVYKTGVRVSRAAERGARHNRGWRHRLRSRDRAVREPLSDLQKIRKIGRILRNMKTGTALRSARIPFISRPPLYINRRLRERDAIEKKVPGDREKRLEIPHRQNRKHIVNTS